MSRQVRFRIVKKHPLDEPIELQQYERVSRVEEINGLLKVIIVRDPGE